MFKRHAALQEYANRIKVVENVEKITSSMKMVAAAKLKIAQQRLEPAADFYASSSAILKGIDSEIERATDKPKKLMLVLTSTDKGLCGAVSSSIVRYGMTLRDQFLKEAGSGAEVSIVSIGTKAADQLAGQKNAASLKFSATELSNKPVAFVEASYIADLILKEEFDSCIIVYNHFVNMLKNDVSTTVIHRPERMAAATRWEETEFDDEASWEESLAEFQLASALWNAINSNVTCEQATRMQSMDAASGNAKELVEGLGLTYNKIRQQNITNELSEIVSGAAAITARLVKPVQRFVEGRGPSGEPRRRIAPPVGVQRCWLAFLARTLSPVQHAATTTPQKKKNTTVIPTRNATPQKKKNTTVIPTRNATPQKKKNT
eukprot:CAMPEP_0170743420 /NCGR_PEP_ID=MMETSP0437-20130122/7255_1 /TAXON_ID=0 /ORGANISM="Sexangularia sp." /LENGTH=375 /DNA_ID=CAMNT_0011082081 /DNA_START=125 /DNA_END=1250 /DNA_ORIENTATION=+